MIAQQLGRPTNKYQGQETWSKEEYNAKCTAAIDGPPGVINALSELIEVTQLTHKYINELEERLNPLLRVTVSTDSVPEPPSPSPSSETKALVSRGTYEVRRVNTRIQELTTRIDL